MRKKDLPAFFLCIFLFLAPGKKLCAQKDSVTAFINTLYSIQKSKPLDTSLFRKHVDVLPSINIDSSDIPFLHKVAESFDNGTDLDYNLYIRIYIHRSFIRTDVDKAIDYGLINLPLFEKNTGANRTLLRSVFLNQLRLPYRNSDRLGEGFLLYNDLLSKSMSANDSVSIVQTYFVLAGFYRALGLYDAAIYHIKKSIAFIDSSNHQPLSFLSVRDGVHSMTTWINHTGVMGQYYNLKGDYATSLLYSRLAYSAGTAYPDEAGNKGNQLKNIASALMGMNKFDSAEICFDSADIMVNKRDVITIASIMQRRAELYIKMGELEKAEVAIRSCWEIIREKKIRAFTPSDVIAPDYYLALVRVAQRKFPEAVELLYKDIERIKGIRLDILRDYKLLGDVYDSLGNDQKSKEAYVRFINLQDSINNDQDKYRMLSFETEELVSAKEKDILKLETDNRISRMLWIFSMGIVLLLGVVALMIYQRYRTKQKDNRVLEKTLTDLKNTQRQLIQSEKMASLGELTAGIAHEIQNPLNFVNNFSEVNKDLIDEMNEHLATGNLEAAKELGDNIKENEEKISHHGKRAEGIVKSMLLHSRTGSGKKESVDINALIDEYLRLAYHGLRARDKSFNAKLETDFDPAIQTVKLIPQDIGRVLLNLVNNALHAVEVKRKSGISNYDPTVKVSSALSDNKVIIKVTDNGTGIPEKIKDKIFQPFFTTKATGQGTGLGLSLSYDIIKSHGGEIGMQSKEGEGSEFTIELPYT